MNAKEVNIVTSGRNAKEGKVTQNQDATARLDIKVMAEIAIDNKIRETSVGHRIRYSKAISLPEEDHTQ